MNPESGILTQILQAYTSLFAIGIGNITIDAMQMLQLLTFFAIFLYGIGALMGYVNFNDGIFKIIKVGGLIWIISDYQNLIAILLDGFIYLGDKAGGGNIAPVLMDDPSAIAELGINMVKPLFDNVEGLDALMDLAGIIYSVIASFIIILSFFAVGVRMFLVYITFHIKAILGLIFIPGAALSFTQPLAEGVIAGLMQEGFKFMALSFIISVMQSLVNTWMLPPDPSFGDITFLMLGSLTMAFLSWYVPGAVSSSFSGRISLSREKR